MCFRYSVTTPPTIFHTLVIKSFIHLQMSKEENQGLEKEMVQQLRALGMLQRTEDPIPSSLSGSSQGPITPAPGRVDTFFPP